MKKIVKVVITILSLTALLSVSIFAVNVDSYTHKHEKTEITIEFLNSNFTKFEQEQIANYLIVGEQAVTANIIICSLLGHSMGATEIISATSHNISSTAPKCCMNTYSVSACTRCDYITSKLVGSRSVTCCP